MDARSAGTDPDEVAADDARLRLHREGVVPIEPDDCIAGLLEEGEFVVATRSAVSLERRVGWHDPGGGLGGDLYVTTRRLVHLGRGRIEYPLEEIREAVAANGLLRLVVGEGRGVEIQVRDPRLLRVEIGAAREAAHAPGGGASPAMTPRS